MNNIFLSMKIAINFQLANIHIFDDNWLLVTWRWQVSWDTFPHVEKDSPSIGYHMRPLHFCIQGHLCDV